MYELGKYILAFLILSQSQGFLVPNGRTSVHTPVGEIIGFTTTMELKGAQQNVRSFLGIPYAEPPVNTNRFKRPVPKSRFSSTFDATNYGPACIQYEGKIKADVKIPYSEDCLTLNIFVPEELPRGVTLYPTMVYTHGGGFMYGTSYGRDCGVFSLNGEVVVVTINYRLNVFGFLSSDDIASQGNYGLWDQQLAIKWVNDNIHAFGGDVNRITVFGESSGAAGVVYQTLYQGNRGLFQRAIAQSGSASMPNSFTPHNRAENITKRFATAAGCNTLNTSNAIRCLQSKSSEEIRHVMNKDAYSFNEWNPVVDREFVLEDPLRTMTGQFPSPGVEDMFKSVDLIIGVNSKEGLAHHYVELSMPNFTISLLHDKLLSDMLFDYLKEDVPASVKEATLLEYTDWSNLGDKDKQLDRFVDLLSDNWFNVDAARTARKHSSYSNKTTFVYKLSTAPAYHLIPVYPGVDSPTVANHADDLAFIFGPWFQTDLQLPTGLNVTLTSEQINVGRAMITMWANFAKTG